MCKNLQKIKWGDITLFQYKNIKRKLFVCFLIIISISSISGIVGSIFMKHADSHVLIENAYSKREENRFHTNLIEESAVLRDIIMLNEKEEIKVSQKELEAIEGKTAKAFEELKINCFTEKDVNLVREIEVYYLQYIKQKESIVSLSLANKKEEAQHEFYVNVRPILNKALHTAQGLEELSSTLGDGVSRNINDESSKRSNIIIFIIAGSIFVSILISIIFVNIISKDIENSKSIL